MNELKPYTIVIVVNDDNCEVVTEWVLATSIEDAINFCGHASGVNGTPERNFNDAVCYTVAGVFEGYYTNHAISREVRGPGVSPTENKD